MKKKRPRIKFPRQMGAVNTADVNSFVKDVHDEMFQDDLLYGRSGCHVSESGEIERLPPETVDEIVARLNAESDGSVLWKTQKLSVEEIIERYPLTEEQKLKLKEHENKFKSNGDNTST